MKKLGPTKLLIGELIFAIPLSLVLFIFQHNFQVLLYTAFLIIALLFIYRSSNLISHIFNILALPYIFLNLYTILLNLLLKRFTKFELGLYILYFIGILVILVPVMVRDYGSIKKPIWELLTSVWLIFNLFLAPSLDVVANQFIMGVNNSNLLLAILFLEYAILVIKGWGYRFYFNLKMNQASIFYYSLLVVLVLVAIWVICFSVFITGAANWEQALWNWNLWIIDLTNSIEIKNIWELIFIAFRAAIMEESARYIFLLTLLISFTKRKRQALEAILLSSAIFSLLHILNFSAPGATLNSVLTQILHTFGFGCILAVIFLYSGKLWLIILLHIFADILSSSLNPLGYSGILLNTKSNIIVGLGIINVIPLICVAIILINKKSRSYVYQNIKIILAK
ncbi:CPBP family intramembrane glutamic endopeptidase [Lactobacillus sp. PV034]|uniref:CPBP family intramembrane glutamic endopeptidase n=1 Tax=Lactobacillus sp. PV034 TaxID=2594495 RepID=UPI00223EEF8A|nr:CPBP family intramembrane glutamic endopeptidase [Lactobacillus sp. PV034]